MFTSYSDTAGTTVVNQVEDVFNGLGQLTTEYQAYGGSVDTTSSPKVQYNYTEMSGSENNSRLRSMVYPNGRILDYQYSSSQEPVSGITSTTTTATATTVVAHGLSIGDKVMIEGAGTHYDGLVTVASVPSSTTFTFTIASFTGSSSGTDITEAKFGIDNSISRVSGLQDRAGTSAGTVLEGYSYLGLGTIVIRNRSEDSTQLTYVQQSGDTSAITDGGDQYTGLDRFGRVIDQYWLNTSTSAAVDRFQYSYDPDGNVLYKNNLVHGSLSELYHANSAANGDNASAYDKINRLTGFSVGTLSSSGHNGSGLDTVSSLNTTPHIYQETWTLDALGNWSTLAQNSGSAVSNSFDKRNRETGFQGNTLTFDNNGNTTVDQSGQHYTYDAWNKVTTIKDSSNTTTLLTETHDALGRVATFNNTAGLQHWYYSNQNQVLEDQFSSIRQQYVWGQGYVNDLILRDRNTDANTSTGAYGKASSGLEERLYAQQDANYNVTTIIDPSQSIKERFVYDPYGGFTNLDSAWATYTDTTWLWSYKFQGTYWEGIAGFYYMGARIYSPALGRFLEADPAGYIDGGNMYNAFRDSPIASTDPLGTDSQAGKIQADPPATIKGDPEADQAIKNARAAEGLSTFPNYGAGTIASPFRSLGTAQAAMQAKAPARLKDRIKQTIDSMSFFENVHVTGSYTISYDKIVGDDTSRTVNVQLTAAKPQIEPGSEGWQHGLYAKVTTNIVYWYYRLLENLSHYRFTTVFHTKYTAEIPFGYKPVVLSGEYNYTCQDTVWVAGAQSPDTDHKFRVVVKGSELEPGDLDKFELPETPKPTSGR